MLIVMTVLLLQVGSPDEVSMPGVPGAASGGVGEGGAGSDGGAPGDKTGGTENGKDKNKYKHNGNK